MKSRRRFRFSLNWLLVFVPVATVLEIGHRLHAPWSSATAIFITACLAIIPLAGWMGKATEHLAERMGAGIGGLLNATFGNAAELIIAIVALRAGLHEVVKASIAGSVIGNVLLVLGAAMLAGGVRHREQSYNAPAARSQATMLTLAAIALVLPAAYRASLGAGAPALGSLSVWISVVLLGVYALNLVFSLVTHATLFAGSPEPDADAHAAVVIADHDDGAEGEAPPALDHLGHARNIDHALIQLFAALFATLFAGPLTAIVSSSHVRTPIRLRAHHRPRP